MTEIKSEHYQPNSLDYEDLVRSAKGELYGPDFAQLPADQMLMISRITKITSQGGQFGKGEIIAELDINPDLWFFKCHFINDPVMPGCLGLDALWQLVGFFLCWSGHPGKGRALGAGDVKFQGQILPDSKLVTYHLQIKRVVARQLILGIANGIVSVDGKQIYQAQDLKVGLFGSGAEF